MQETSYKILTQLYITPSKIKSWSPSAFDICWHCNSEKGTFLHLCWTCLPISHFFLEPCQKMDCIHHSDKIRSMFCLLHVNAYSCRQYKKSLTRHLLNAAKSVVLYYLQSSYVPTTKDWSQRVNYIYNMEETIAMKKETTSQFHKTWIARYLFTQSEEFKALSN